MQKLGGGDELYLALTDARAAGVPVKMWLGGASAPRAILPSMSTSTSDQDWLAGFLRTHGGIAGTVHRVREGELALCAAVNIPPPVQAIVARVPCGKGMAGLAWERREAVQTCNLKTDASGQVRPGARAVEAQAAVALPVLDDQGGVRAVVGIAFQGERELEAGELGRLGQAAAGLAGH